MLSSLLNILEFTFRIRKAAVVAEIDINITSVVCKNIATQMERSLICALEVGGCGAARHDFRPLSQHATAAVCNEREFGPKRTSL